MRILLAMVVGIVLGYALRRQERLLLVADMSTTGLVYLLLFLLGISVGGNSVILNAFGELGVEALLLSIGAIVGSVVFVAPLGALLFRGRKNNEE